MVTHHTSQPDDRADDRRVDPPKRTARRFRPSFVVAVPGGWLAVDELQPVAVTVEPTGNVLDVASWNRLSPPRAVEWPRREVIADGRSVWVHDPPDGPTVRLEVTPQGRLEATQAAVPAGRGDLSRAYSCFSLNRDITTENGVVWRIASQLSDYRWVAHVRRETVRDRESWLLGDGSIVAFAPLESTAAACVRRAPKRPWAFRPDHDLVLLGDPSGPTMVRPDGLDIGRLCWPGPTPADIAPALADYLHFTVGECRSAIDAGASGLRFSVHDLDGLPTIETSFVWGSSGTRFVHLDEPLDELGRPGGFRFLNINLDEDMRGSDLYRRPRSETTVYL